MKVMKFGGGCLKDGGHFLIVGGLIRSEDELPIVIISAISGVTDLLADSIRAALQSVDNIPDIVHLIRSKHEQVIEGAIEDSDTRIKTLQAVKLKIQKLERLLYGISFTEHINPELKASILSYGERLCSCILAQVLSSTGKNAIDLAGDEIGLITDNNPDNATAILPEVKRELKPSLKPYLNENTIPVIPGFFGRSLSGHVATFGRNGSDYGAAVIAYGMNASALEIWKDVDGFMSADPCIIQEAARIETLSYDEAAELSYFGARIMHPRTVEPIAALEIPVHIKHLYRPESLGTVIKKTNWISDPVVKSVTFNRTISVLRIHGPGVGYKPGIIAGIGQTLAANGINIYSILTSQTCINLLLDKNDAQKSYDSIQVLGEGSIKYIDIVNDLALIAVVGEGLQSCCGVAAQVFSAVAEENINIEMISSGASEVAYYFIVREIEMEKAVCVIHENIIKRRQPA